MFKKISIAAIIAIVFLGLGIFIGIKISKKPIPQGAATNAENTYQAGWDAAKARLSQSPMGRIIPEGMEIRNISGSIQKIEGNKVIVKINLTDPLSDPALDIRIVTIDSNTKISLNAQKDPAQFQKDMQEFQDKMKAQQGQVDASVQQAPLFPPMSFEQKEIKISDLKENQQVSVIANENIKDKKEFIAAEINAEETGVTAAAQTSSVSDLNVAPVVTKIQE